MEALKDSVKEAINKRLESPIFGFIFLSWVVANWDTILILAFSKETMEARIANIATQDIYYYFRRVVLPVVSGIVLAVIYPYCHIIMDKLHNKAVKHKDKAQLETALRKLDEDIILSEKKAEADIADEKYRSFSRDALTLQEEENKTKIEREKTEQEVAKLGIEQAINALKEVEEATIRLKEDQLLAERNLASLVNPMFMLMRKFTRMGRVINHFDELNPEASGSSGFEIFLRNEIKDTFNKEDRVFLANLAKQKDALNEASNNISINPDNEYPSKNEGAKLLYSSNSSHNTFKFARNATSLEMQEIMKRSHEAFKKEKVARAKKNNSNIKQIDNN